MAVDKKVLAGKLRLVLLQDIGQSLVTEDFEHKHLHAMLDEIPRIDSKSLAS
jgi:3-dehydroquinate synthase